METQIIACHTGITMVCREFGLKLRTLREGAGFTQEQLADHANIATRALQTLESGNGNPGLDTLIKLSKALGVAITELVEAIPAEHLDKPGVKKSLSQEIKHRKAREEQSQFDGLKNPKFEHGVSAMPISEALDLLKQIEAKIPPSVLHFLLTTNVNWKAKAPALGIRPTAEVVAEFERFSS